MDSWLTRRIRRSGQFGLFLWGAAAALVLWWAATNLGPWVKILRSPSTDHDTAYWGLGLSLAFLALFGWLLRRALGHARDPSTHPVWKRVAQWGDPDALSAQIEREAGAPLLKAGGWLFGENYLIRRGGVRILRWRDLLWAHKHVTSHSINFIPTGKTYRGKFYWLDDKLDLSAGQKAVDAALQVAAQRAPWAILGYNDQVAKLYPRKKQELHAAVEQRYQQWRQQARGTVSR